MNPSHASRAPIARGLIIAGLVITVPLVLKLLSPDHLSPELASRLLGVLLGAVVVVYANAVPKALSPMLRTRCDPAAEQRMRRFTGWSLVLGGVAYAVAWVIAPLEYANALSAGLLSAALVVVVVRIVRGMAKGAH